MFNHKVDKMKPINLLLTFIFILTLTACQDSGTLQINDTSKILATVGDYAVTENYLNTYMKTKGMTEPSQAQTEQSLDEVVQQLALRHQMMQNDQQLPLETLLAIEQVKHRAQAQLALEELLAKSPITEAEIKAEYQKVTDDLQGQEYHVHHLLFQDEIQALEVLDQIEDGFSFATAETDYLSAFDQVKNVGDIGWVNLRQVPEAFRLPLQSLQAGEVYQQPVISQFGVHVLFLEAKRAAQPPDFESVKPGILKTLEQQKINRYKQLAVIKAKVKLHK